MIQLLCAALFLLHCVGSDGRIYDAKKLSADKEVEELNLKSVDQRSSSTGKLLFSIFDDLKFQLYTSDPFNPEELFTGDKTTVTNSSFDVEKETKILIHGIDSGFLPEMTTALLGTRNCNVITVEWPWASYFNPSQFHVVVGGISEFLDFLVDEELGINVTTIHLIGHTMGGHIAGLAGGQMKKSKLPRITGLAPPRTSSNTVPRLDRSQADFVDVIHTTSFGYMKPIGHVDFYLNGDDGNLLPLVQPGCEYSIKIPICSATRSYEYYIGSLYENQPDYLATRCTSYFDFKRGNCCQRKIKMGEYVDKSARGKFYLNTRGKEPYGMGEEGIPRNCRSKPKKAPQWYDL